MAQFHGKYLNLRWDDKGYWTKRLGFSTKGITLARKYSDAFGEIFKVRAYCMWVCVGGEGGGGGGVSEYARLYIDARVYIYIYIYIYIGAHVNNYIEARP